MIPKQWAASILDVTMATDSRQGFKDHVEQAIERSVAEERERCAKVAETCGSADQPTMEGRPVIPSVRRHGAEIAAAIRKGKP